MYIIQKTNGCDLLQTTHLYNIKWNNMIDT